MVITIDGPAGAGKSSVAKALARRLGLRFLDTGAMYRTVAYAAVQQGLAWEDSDTLAELARNISIDVSEERVLLDGEDVTLAIRSMEITSVIHHVADNPAIRGQLVELQREVASSGDYVTEGRDQGTVAFPDAAHKIFLTASPKVRAERRMQELEARGESMSFDEVLKLQDVRDERDRTRKVGALVAAPDAILVTSDHKGLDQVVDEIEAIVKRRFAEGRT